MHPTRAEPASLAREPLGDGSGLLETWDPVDDGRLPERPLKFETDVPSNLFGTAPDAIEAELYELFAELADNDQLSGLNLPEDW